MGVLYKGFCYPDAATANAYLISDNLDLVFDAVSKNATLGSDGIMPDGTSPRVPSVTCLQKYGTGSTQWYYVQQTTDQTSGFSAVCVPSSYTNFKSYLTFYQFSTSDYLSARLPLISCDANQPQFFDGVATGWLIAAAMAIAFSATLIRRQMR